MEKYGVDTTKQEKEKQASGWYCPECAKAAKRRGTRICTEHGSKPFEEKPAKDSSGS